MSYDVIVVGAGAAGAPLAAHLSERTDRSVLLLEAGPDYASVEAFPRGLKDSGNMQGAIPGHPNNWAFVGHLTPDLTYTVARGRIIGGSTSINGTYFVRGRKEDFERYVELGNDEWSYEKVLACYREIEHDLTYGENDVHGGSGAVPITRALDNPHPLTRAFYEASAELGFSEELDKNGQALPGYGPIPMNVRDGVRVNSAFAFVNPARGRPNLTVRGDATVRRILFKGVRAVGVEVENGGSISNVAGREIVLCAGAVKSPHLLLLSGIGPKKDLEAVGIPVLADRPGVGRSVSDHPDIAVLYRVTREVHWTVSGDAMQAVLNFSATNSPFEGGDLEIIHTLKPFGVWVFGRRMSDPRGLVGLVRRPSATVKALRGASLTRLAQQIAHRNDFALLAAVQQPHGRGRITIESADPDRQPRIDYHYLDCAEDVRRMREVVRTAIALLQTKAYRPYVARIEEPSPDVAAVDDRLDAWMRSHLATAIHASSSCRMGPATDPYAVVDQYGRVYEVDGLWVADTSILPTAVSRGPAATAMMIGARISRFISDGATS